jgi:hypothetical protein
MVSSSQNKSTLVSPNKYHKGCKPVDVDCQAGSERVKGVSPEPINQMVRCMRVACAMLLGLGAFLTCLQLPVFGAQPIVFSHFTIQFAAQLPNLKSRMRIARADREFEETKKAGDEILELVSELRDRIRDNGVLAASDHKTVDRLKKLAKKIRSDFGGEGAPQLENVPTTLAGIAEAVGERARGIEGQLEKVTRYEVNKNLIVLAGDLMVLSDAMKSFGTTR